MQWELVNGVIGFVTVAIGILALSGAYFQIRASNAAMRLERRIEFDLGLLRELAKFNLQNNRIEHWDFSLLLTLLPGCKLEAARKVEVKPGVELSEDEWVVRDQQRREARAAITKEILDAIRQRLDARA